MLQTAHGCADNIQHRFADFSVPTDDNRLFPKRVQLILQRLSRISPLHSGFPFAPALSIAFVHLESALLQPRCAYIRPCLNPGLFCCQTQTVSAAFKDMKLELNTIAAEGRCE